MKSKKTDEWIVSHELTHHLFQHEPNVFKAILEEMEVQNPITNEQIEKYRKRIHNGDKLSREDIVEEMVADAMFNVVKQTNILKGIATKNPTMAERIIEVLNSIVQKLKDLVYTPLGLSARQGKALENAVFRLAGEVKDGNGNRLFSKKGGYLSSVRTNLALDDNIATDTVEDKDGNVAYVNNIMDNLFGKIKKRAESKTKGETAAERLARDEEAFGKLVDTLDEQEKTELHPVMQTPLVLQLVGAKDLPIKIRHSDLKKITVGKHKDAKSIDNVKKLPTQMADPVAIFKSATRDDSYVMMLELTDENGSTYVASIALESIDQNTGLKINQLTSAYGRGEKRPNNTWFVNQEKNGKLLYVNTKKASSWSEAVGVQFPRTPHQGDALSNSRVKHESDLVKLKNEFPTKYSLFKDSSENVPHSTRLRKIIERIQCESDEA